ncbi:Short-chain dehydrogenase [Arenibacter troitsensis]|uniref:Short-chain dehydrogenase n=1 Tax=Arenibacter troitsensis TaxID=188872 RepID=A0A1X7L147_9FLAO|nr:SDR family oxidoreductase [Arenibacter troitsensis]SMG47435.1 Short-chain dehydrogenase [Arenibacter troitsensis]
MKKLKTKVDRVVWITGASSGIGEALTFELNRKGYKLIISSRKLSDLQSVKTRCPKSELISLLPLDLMDRDTMSEKVTEAMSFYGSIDLLINNAGISQRSLIMETDLQVYQKLMDVNYMGTIALSKAILPYFVTQQKGHFVTVTSLMGKFGSPFRSGYCGAKHALHGFFDALRMEHEIDNIKVTMVCPGFVNTNVAINALTADGSPQVDNDVATKNGLSPQVFAKKMVKAIEKEKFEVYIGQKEVFGIYLKRFFPKLLHRLVLRSKVR